MALADIQNSKNVLLVQMVDWEKGNSLQLLPSRCGVCFSALWIWAVFHLTLVGTMLQKGCSLCYEQSFNNLWVHPLLLLEPCELHVSKSVTHSWRIWDHVERCPTYFSWGNSQLTTDPWASSPEISQICPRLKNSTEPSHLASPGIYELSIWLFS